jgi:hypothetical protein
MGWLVTDAPAALALGEPSAVDGAAVDDAAADDAGDGVAVEGAGTAVDALGDAATRDGALCAAEVEWHAVATKRSAATAPKRA